MYKILTLNNISIAGLERLPRDLYEVASEITHPDAILLRSFKMHTMEIPTSLKAVGRAGAGVNNIPIDAMSKKGIPVFNAPGANANAVKELVLAGMLMASRNIHLALDYVKGLQGSNEEIGKAVEAGKKQYVGHELPGRTLGVVGLGAIGVKVANAARNLGMHVIGYDPGISVKSAWQVSSDVEQARSLDDLLERSDYVTFHIPLIDATRDMINTERLQFMKDNVVILNFSRQGIINEEAILSSLNQGKAYAYVCDFPTKSLMDHQRVIALPHLGASTAEAENNCAIMVAEQVKEYLENGNILNSVNFPEVSMARTKGCRITIANSNVPNMVGQISTALAKADLNISDMINKSKGDIAYTLVDTDEQVPENVIKDIENIEGVLAVRLLTV